MSDDSNVKRDENHAVNQRMALAELIRKRNEIGETMFNLERQIYAFEGSYIDEAHPIGNIIHGYHLPSGQKAESNGRKITDHERIFSHSSVTSSDVVRAVIQKQSSSDSEDDTDRSLEKPAKKIDWVAPPQPPQPPKPPKPPSATFRLPVTYRPPSPEQNRSRPRPQLKATPRLKPHVAARLEEEARLSSLKLADDEDDRKFKYRGSDKSSKSANYLDGIQAMKLEIKRQMDNERAEKMLYRANQAAMAQPQEYQQRRFRSAAERKQMPSSLQLSSWDSYRGQLAQEEPRGYYGSRVSIGAKPGTSGMPMPKRETNTATVCMRPKNLQVNDERLAHVKDKKKKKKKQKHGQRAPETRPYHHPHPIPSLTASVNLVYRKKGSSDSSSSDDD